MSIGTTARAHRLLAYIVLATIAIGPIRGAGAEIQPPATLSEAIGFFAREKSVAEDGAAILKAHGQDKGVTAYADGIRKYAEAKAAFNGLIEQLLAALALDEQIDLSPRFQEALRDAAAKRVAFTSYVDETILADTGGVKGVPYAVIFEQVPKLVTAIVDAGIKIWREYHNVQSERKTAIKDQLGALKWRPFSAVPALE